MLLALAGTSSCCNALATAAPSLAAVVFETAFDQRRHPDTVAEIEQAGGRLVFGRAWRFAGGEQTDSRGHEQPKPMATSVQNLQVANLRKQQATNRIRCSNAVSRDRDRRQARP